MTEASPAPESAFRCSALSASAGESALGTASRIANWLLIEQPGAWGADPLLQSRLPGRVGEELRDRSRAALVRVILVRRAGESSTSRTVYLARTTPGSEFLLHGTVDSADQLLDLDLEGLAAGRAPEFGVPERKPLFLVCTNGRHDVCCAERGRPVYRTMRAHAPDRVWECSHIGGDRFAANVVTLPAGAYFGRVTPGDAIELMRGMDSGMVDLDRFRGRSAYPMPVQAAEGFLRRREDLAGIDDLRYEGRVRTSEDELTVSFTSAEGNRFAVVIGMDRAPDPRRLTCNAAEETSPTQYELRGISAE